MLIHWKEPIFQSVPNIRNCPTPTVAMGPTILCYRENNTNRENAMYVSWKDDIYKRNMAIQTLFFVCVGGPSGGPSSISPSWWQWEQGACQRKPYSEQSTANTVERFTRQPLNCKIISSRKLLKSPQRALTISRLWNKTTKAIPPSLFGRCSMKMQSALTLSLLSLKSTFSQHF